MNMKQLSLDLAALQGTVSQLAAMMEKIAAMQANTAQAEKVIRSESRKAREEPQHDAPVRDYNEDLTLQPWRLEWEAFKEFRSTCRPSARSRYLATVLERELGRRTGFVEATLYDAWRKDADEAEVEAVWKALGHKGIPKAL